ncbi:MAG: hypothetical protein KF873_00955 [Gemmataceae bacterium]|nr:toxin-antitoxin system HicB family antitoxin [Planctomycetia bacterium]MBX3397281.1 hypothetical protein [Gemmataceae bacterium]
MNGFLVELPVELRIAIAQRTGNRPDGESEWIAEAVREKLSADSELEALERRAARGDREAFLRVLSKAPAAPPIPGDERPPSSDPSP